MSTIKDVIAGLTTSKDGGLLSLIKDKTGKLSFRRSVPLLLITGIVIPDYTVNGLGKWNVIVILIACFTYLAPYYFEYLTDKKP